MIFPTCIDGLSRFNTSSVHVILYDSSTNSGVPIIRSTESVRLDWMVCDAVPVPSTTVLDKGGVWRNRANGGAFCVHASAEIRA